MNMPKPTDETVALFHSITPLDVPGVEQKKMFGFPSAFVNGNLFMGVYGDTIMMRLASEDRAEYLKLDGAELFEPMPGRPMKEYVVATKEILGDPEQLHGWVQKSLAFGSGLPLKEKKPPKEKKAAKKG